MNTTPADLLALSYPAGLILVGRWNGRTAPGYVVTDSRFKVLPDGRLRLQGSRSHWIDSMESVEKSYGPLRPESTDAEATK